MRRGRSMSPSGPSKRVRADDSEGTLSGSESDSDIQSGKIRAHGGDFIYDRCKDLCV
jgi:hypothetical protein